MSEERFEIYQDGIRKFESNRIWGVKSETNSLEPYMTFKEAEKCCDLLNEQQSTINQLEKVNGKNFAKRRLLEQDNLVLRNENEQLRKELKEIKENPINYF